MLLFRLVCQARGEPKPTVFWTRENKANITVVEKGTGRRTAGNQNSFREMRSFFPPSFLAEGWRVGVTRDRWDWLADYQRTGTD